MSVIPWGAITLLQFCIFQHFVSLVWKLLRHIKRNWLKDPLSWLLSSVLTIRAITLNPYNCIHTLNACAHSPSSIGGVVTTRVEVLDLCFDFLEQKLVCFDRLNQILVYFDIFDQNLAWFDFLDPTKQVFDLVRPCSDMFWLYRPNSISFDFLDCLGRRFYRAFFLRSSIDRFRFF